MTQRSSADSATLREELADFDAALAVLPELERRRHRRAGLSLGGEVLHRQLLAGILLQRGFRIERVDVRRPAVGEDVDDALGFAGELRAAWARAGLIGALAAADVDETGLREDARQRERAHAHAALVQELAAAELIVFGAGAVVVLGHRSSQ